MSAPVAAMVVQSSHDPALVALAAESLGSSIENYGPKINLSSDWIRRVQGSGFPTQLAVWAVDNCLDEDLLNELAKTTNSTAVATALAYHNCLDEQALKALTRLAQKRKNNAELLRAIDRTPSSEPAAPTIEDFLDSPDDIPERPNTKIRRLLSTASPAQHQRFLDRVLASGLSEYTTDYLLYCCQAEHELDWSALTADPVPQIKSLSATHRREVLSQFITHVSYMGSSSPVLPDPLAALALDELGPDFFQSRLSYCAPQEGSPIFSKRMVDHILTNPSLSQIASFLILTNKQFEAILDKQSPEDLVGFYPAANTPQRVGKFLRALAAFPMTKKLRMAIDNSEMIDWMLSPNYNTNPLSPAHMTLLATLANTGQAYDYLSGAWEVYDDPALPSKAAAARVIAAHDFSKVIGSAALDAESYGASEAYVKYLLDTLPGEAWRYICASYLPASHVYSRLAATGDIRLALDQLECHPTASLSDICATTSALLSAQSAGA